MALDGHFRSLWLSRIRAYAGARAGITAFAPWCPSRALAEPGREPAVHERFGRVASRWPREIVIATAALLILSFALAPLLGTEFIPTLDEGTINLDVMQVPSISLEDAVRNATAAEKADAGTTGGGSRREPNRPARDRNRHLRSGRERRVRCS